LLDGKYGNYFKTMIPTSTRRWHHVCVDDHKPLFR